jgi:hypothetical protein
MNVVAKELQWFTNDNFRGTSKDSMNALISLSLTSPKDTLPPDDSNSDIQGTFSGVLGGYFNNWEIAQADYLSRAFQGDSESLITLSQAFKDGLMVDNPIPDQESLKTGVQHVMYSQLVLEAWKIGPGEHNPKIL